MKCVVKLIWSDESRSWSTRSDDVPGLLLASNSFDALIERVRMALPEFLELDQDYTGDIQLSFEAERTEDLRCGTALSPTELLL